MWKTWKSYIIIVKCIVGICEQMQFNINKHNITVVELKEKNNCFSWKAKNKFDIYLFVYIL